MMPRLWCQLTMLIACAGLLSGSAAYGQAFYEPDWGSGYSNCAGATAPVRFKIGTDSYAPVVVSAVVACRDDGDAYSFVIDYANLVLPKGSEWNSAHFEWFGAAAQKQGSGGRNDWIYDEVRPIRVNLKTPDQVVAVANIAFRVPKRILSQARGFGFYIVGGGIFSSLSFQGKFDESDATLAPQSASRAPDKPAEKQVSLSTEKSQAATNDAASTSTLTGRPEWGEAIRTCEGAKQPQYFKAAGPDNEIIQSNGIITCVDNGDSFTYAVEFMSFSLAPGSPWKSAHLEWFGAGIQRAGLNGNNDWIYDEVRPIRVEIGGDRKRSAVTKLSFQVSKAAMAQARGFGFYVVGGGIVWSIFLL